MDERILKWLYDIKIAIGEIEDFFADRDKSLKSYKDDIILKRAVERNLEIIGEAVNRIKQRDAEFISLITEANSIIGLRNHVIHSYDNVSDENIWSILNDHLPTLKKEVDELIGEL
ncbi:DUF86 domain-containing protein [Flavobacterium sp.]|uniref:HepT-like ribonuclease domain-containing protein n=1 Tax=Flavobacterium sp. TaxID=239 RepID=UPI0039E6A165